MGKNINFCFSILVYIVCIYLFIVSIISKPPDYLIFIVALLIWVSHVYKDVTKLEKWPLWTEPIGFLLGVILLIRGIYIKNWIVMFLGLFKIVAHIRQILFKNNLYYLLNT